MTDDELSRGWLETEWLETNGIGGYASSTVGGMNTRRYHGLLVAAMKPPVGRMVLLSKLEETLIVPNGKSGERFQLSANRWASGVVEPQRFLQSFRTDPFPVWTFSAGGVEVTRKLWMVQGENTVVVEYEIGAPDCELEVRPLLAFRDYHWLQQAHPLDVTSLHFQHDGATVDPGGDWYYGFDYEREREREFPSSEDLYHPFTLRFSGQKARVIASTEPDRKTAAPRVAMERCDQFIVKRGEGHSIIAGYHWFADWGRDAMVSLTGLTLATGRHDVAKSILLAFASVVSEGMLPNRFPDSGEQAEYNTIDATLWFFEAARSYLDFSDDIRDQIYPVLREIVDWHLRGTRYGIRMDTDGLLTCDGAQLTWMDTAATPRRGKAVEIQALWYNALRILEELGDSRCGDLAKRCAESFHAQFWNESTGCLFDLIGDPSIRPNQLFAISLRYPLISGERAESILKVVERELLTPVGLRTLSPHDPQYRGRYEGGPAERDAAYHQGTVWPWLLGAWVDACKKTRGHADFTFKDTGLIPEIFDGDAPHTPRGCIAQAWSLAELIRIGLVNAKINT